MSNPDPQDWTPYWRRPTLTSFGDIFPNNYDGSILEFWQRQLTGQLQHVVDVACGNGALTWIANSILNRDGNRTRVTGVDFADIDPFAALKRKPGRYPQVRFIGNTPAEQLPFADASVDLLISQYGIEYSDLSRSVPEAARVLVPGASPVLHSARQGIHHHRGRHRAAG